MMAILNYLKIFLALVALLLTQGGKALAATEDVKAHRISGVVVKLSGAPLAGAPVYLLETDHGGFLNLFFPSVLDRPIASVITDARGRFVLRATSWNPTKFHKLSVEGLTRQATKIPGEIVTSGSVSIVVNKPNGNFRIYVPNDFIPPPPIHVEPSQKKKRG
jgi:hypothetical protein